jgi:hypothetical protein
MLPMPWLIGGMTAPIGAGCFEWCDLGRRFAAVGFLLVGVLWLLAVLVVAWSWRDREPTIVVLSAAVASSLLLIVAMRIFHMVSVTVITDDVFQLAWVLGLGLQLPPVWRLSKRTSPSKPLRLIVGMMAVAVAVAAFSVVLLGTSAVWSTGAAVVLLVWITFVVCLIPITARAWRDGIAELSLIGPLLAASLPILLLPVGIAAPGDIAYVIFLPLPLSSIAWLWIAAAWLRGVGSPPPIDRGPASVEIAA